MRTLIAIIATGLLVGTTSATAASLVTSANIKNNTVKSRDVKNRTLTLRDFAPSTVRALRGRRGARGPQGTQGAPGAPGIPGPKGTTDIVYVDGPVITVGPGASAGTYATCPAGSMATGGGIGPATEAQLLPIDAYNISGGGFGVFAVNPDSSSRTLQARAACASR